MSTRTERDLRQGHRYPVPGHPQVFDELAGQVLGRALDLSGGGLKLLVAEPLVAETLYQVRFALPMSDGRSEAIVAGLQVIDPRSDDDGLHYAGTRFIHMEGVCARHIVHWLAMQSAR